MNKKYIVEVIERENKRSNGNISEFDNYRKLTA